MRTLSLVGESLPEGKPVPVGFLTGLVPLDERHGVFPNFVMTPLLSALWAFSNEGEEISTFWPQVSGLLESVDRRFNAFTKDDTDAKNPSFEIHPTAEQRLSEFDTATELWALFGFQTVFGLLRWVLKGDRIATKKQIKTFASEFLKSALEKWTPESGLPKKLPRNMCAQEGFIHRLCTKEDDTGSGVVAMLYHAIKQHATLADQSHKHMALFRCFVPLLHNEAYQLAPYGVGQANFSLADDYEVKGASHASELYWIETGKTLRRRLIVQDVVGRLEMSAFPNWKDHTVRQRRPRTGCIPTGYEMILRSVNAQGVDFDSFQDDFDLDIDLGRGQSKSRNHFGTVAAEVRKKYPWVEFEWKSFDSGNEKVALIEKQISSGRSVLVSLAMRPFGGGGWHIMPIVDATSDKYLLLERVDADGTPKTKWIEKTVFADVHDKFDGGCEVAYLANLGKPTDCEESK